VVDLAGSDQSIDWLRVSLIKFITLLIEYGNQKLGDVNLLLVVG
jgi:hypothetical protein